MLGRHSSGRSAGIPILRAPASLGDAPNGVRHARGPRGPVGRRAHAMHRRAILGHPLGEQRHDLVTWAFVLGAVVARYVGLRGVAEGRTDALKDVGPGVAGRPRPQPARARRTLSAVCRAMRGKRRSSGRARRWSGRAGWPAGAAPPFAEGLGCGRGELARFRPGRERAGGPGDRAAAARRAALARQRAARRPRAASALARNAPVTRRCGRGPSS